MPPPTITASSLPTRFFSTAILVETLAPPTMATDGRRGASSASFSACNSSASSGPAAAGSSDATATIEAWARWAQEKASLT